MNAIAVAWVFVAASCLVTFLGAPEAGLFLAFAAAVVAILAAVQPGEERRDAHRRNHARRR
jgi:hypothetical protein